MPVIKLKKSAKYWVVSDQHFAHDNIVKHRPRFRDTVDMDEGIIEAHNALVKPKDFVYHLGDFAFKNPAKYLRALNGTHFLIKGNHDSAKQVEKAGFAWIKDVAMVQHDKTLIWLSHYPHLVWPQASQGCIHLHGHTHGGIQATRIARFDTGIDRHPYRPQELSDYIEQAKHRQHLGNYHDKHRVGYFWV